MILITTVKVGEKKISLLKAKSFKRNFLVNEKQKEVYRRRILRIAKKYTPNPFVEFIYKEN